MKREVYESQKAFAGEKKPSMLRRCVGHDYTERMMYMVTMVTEGRRPLFGKVTGRSDAPADNLSNVLGYLFRSLRSSLITGPLLTHVVGAIVLNTIRLYVVVSRLHNIEIL